MGPGFFGADHPRALAVVPDQRALCELGELCVNKNHLAKLAKLAKDTPKPWDTTVLPQLCSFIAFGDSLFDN